MEVNFPMDESRLRILVVDDENPIRRFLRTSLGRVYTVFEAQNGEEALRATADCRPDLIVLDLGLPDVDGVEVTRRLREWTQVPIIVVSARDREESKIEALDAGADDYLSKPFGTGELMARIRATLRRSTRPDNIPVFQHQDLVVNLTKRRVTVGEKMIALTPTEYDILRVLVQHSGKVLTHKQLIQMVWGNNYEAGSHLLRVNVSNLRRKIEADPVRPRHIITEPGVGYRLKDTEDN